MTAAGVLILLWVVLMGLNTGSLLTALTYRVPRGEPMMGFIRSRCPRCEHPLNWIDLIPGFGWIIRRGRCAYCHASISWRYVTMEFGTMALWIAYWAVAPTLPVMLALLLVGSLLVALFVIDLEHPRLPTGLLVTLLLAAVLYRGLAGGLTEGLLGAAIVALLALAVRWALAAAGRNILRTDDVLFLAAVGLMLPLPTWPVFLALGAVSWLVLTWFWQRGKAGRPMALGAPVAVSAALCLMWPDVVSMLSGVGA